MPRKKKSLPAAPFASSPDRSSSIHERIAAAARMFTSEILLILGSSTLSDLTALRHEGPAALGPVPFPLAARSAAPAVPRKSLDFLKSIGRIQVRCPVPGCTARGIRSKQNFCMEHAAKLSPAEKQRMRDTQRAKQIAARGQSSSDSNGASKQLPTSKPPKASSKGASKSAAASKNA